MERWAQAMMARPSMAPLHQAAAFLKGTPELQEIEI
jgi:hypothetical protein